MYIDCDCKDIEINYLKILEKVDKVTNLWVNRTLTLMGRVLVVNTLIASLFVYSLMSMLRLSEKQIKEIEGRICKYLWKGKKPQIGYDTLTKDKTQGGLKLIDLCEKQCAIKISWIFKIDHDNLLSKCAYENLNNRIGNLIWKCNLKVQDVDKSFRQTFWMDFLKDWCHCNYHDPQTCAEIKQEIIWFNSNICVANRPICWFKWYDKGIIRIADLYNEQDCIKSYEELQVDWLEWLQLTRAIPVTWKLMITDQLGGNACKPLLYDKLCKSTKISSRVYNRLIFDKRQRS